MTFLSRLPGATERLRPHTSGSGRFGTSLVASAGLHGGLLVAAALAGHAALRRPTPAAVPMRPVAVARIAPSAPFFAVPVPETFSFADAPLPDEDPELVEVEAPVRPTPPDDPLREVLVAPSLAEYDLDLDVTVFEVALDTETPPVEDPPVEPTPSESAMVAEPVTVPSVLLESPAPRYPRRSIRAGEEGTVRCRLLVGADGRVTKVEVVESSGFARLDEAAVDALLRWRFAPETEDGAPVPSEVEHPVTFVLESH